MTVTTVLALATWGSTTKNRNDPICFVPPKVVKASTIVTIVCPRRQHFQLKTLPMETQLK
jgi:hypothetical protein